MNYFFKRWADFQFFIVALARVRRAAVLASKIPALAPDMRLAIKEFDTSLPMLKNMRDVAEHFDDYSMGRGRIKGIRRQALEVGVTGPRIFQWPGYELDADAALQAARRLFQSIQRARC